ncbi:MAG TPA: hypothetical protein VEI97_17095 [bacterium]|nr:hypothetical protein [bacterium]
MPVSAEIQALRQRRSRGTRIRVRRANREIPVFLQGFWTGIGVAALTGGAAWIAVRQVLERRESRTLPSRLARMSNQDTFTIGDYSSIGGNEAFREHAREMEETYAARQRNLQAIQDSLTNSDLRGRTEMKPWLDHE